MLCHNPTTIKFWLSICLILMLAGCSSQSAAQALEPQQYDLVIFTYQEDAVYEPIIKEYQERTGLSVNVIHGTYGDLQERILAGTLAEDCDVVLGIDSATLEQTPECWEPYLSPESDFHYREFSDHSGLWTGFSALPLVIMYNTRVVTYRELPEGFYSLLEPRWKGRIAFVDPELSDIYTGALAAAMLTADEPDAYIKALAESLNYTTFTSLSDVNQAIAEGRCFLGVTLEEHAESLRQEGADIDYIYPQEGTSVLISSSALVSGCRHPEQGRAFIDFTAGKDVQYFLSSNVNRRSVRTDIPSPQGLGSLTQPSIRTDTSVPASKRCQQALFLWQTVQQNDRESPLPYDRRNDVVERR